MHAPRMRWVGRLLLGWAAWSMSAGGASASPMYDIVDLGTLPGQTDSMATGINDKGQVVGVSANGLDLSGNDWPRLNYANNPNASSFLYSGGQMTQIHPVGGPAQAINDAGQVVGGPYTSINSAGQYVAGSTLVSGGVTTSLGNFGAQAINDSGGMAGSVFYNHPAISQGGQVTDLIQSLGLNSVYGHAYAINKAGDVLFYYLDKNNTDLYGNAQPRYMIRYADGHAIDMPGGEIMGKPSWLGMPSALNDLGQVVGQNFLYSNGKTYPLGDLIPSAGHWDKNLVAMAINDAGQIAGYGEVDGHLHAFLMTPADPQTVPEPTTMAMLGIASGWYLARRRRRGRPRG